MSEPEHQRRNPYLLPALKLVLNPRVYIAGPMSGYPEYNVDAFDAAEAQLVDAGYRVLSPASTSRDLGFNREWSDYLRAGVTNVCKADVVVVLDDWQTSRGAALEVHVAHALGIPVVPLRVALVSP